MVVVSDGDAVSGGGGGGGMSKRKGGWWAGMRTTLAGAAGGWGLVLVGHPFDTVKVRLQTQAQHGEGRVYSGAWDCVKKTVQWEGIRGFYKGVASPLVGNMFIRGINYYTFMEALHFLSGGVDMRRTPNSMPALPLADFWMAGGLVGITVTSLESPVDMFKSQMQVQIMTVKQMERGVLLPGQTHHVKPQLYKNVFDCAFRIARTYGLRGIYLGAGATVVRNAPSYSVYYGVNEGTRRLLSEDGELSNSAIIVSAGAAGILFWLSVYPLDVIKSAMQSDHLDPRHRRYHTIVDCARQMYTEQGIARFWRGLTPCMARAVPANAAMWLAIEYTLRWLPQ
eukprot:TRINITY_DN13136_c0_g1_i1.p1 TRINITY_DN13136_c0_g1~~TRINITY_DN13136_c0_g1_i1.p1  ORF type:complete len:338 (-),score=37.24 TRINITY_DN13136_c0_g1_i1:46-1059(-)